MRYFAITGHPVLHSKTPSLFRAAYPGAGEEMTCFCMAASSAEEARRLFTELGLTGMSITAPFKEASHWPAAEISEAVSLLGVGNSYLFQKDHYTFFNTDVDGVAGALQAAGITIRGQKCLVVGAGGAGKAAAYALHRQGGEVVVLNRTVERAAEAARQIGCAYGGMELLADMLAVSKIVVYTLYAGVDVIREEWLHEGQVVLDALYHHSPMKAKALRRGCLYRGGEEWLLYQGVAAYRAFTGREPEVNSMRVGMTTRHTPRHISLIGFMGVGKSTVAPLLARKLGRACFDTDDCIEKRYGMTVPELIRGEGEAAFREKEALIVAELLDREMPSVISCGGGVVTNEGTRRRLHDDSLAIWLYAPPACCMQRMGVVSRPLLAGFDDPLQEAIRLFGIRKPWYAQTARMLVDAGERDVESVTEMIYGEVCRL